MLTIAEDCCLL